MVGPSTADILILLQYPLKLTISLLSAILNVVSSESIIGSLILS